MRGGRGPGDGCRVMAGRFYYGKSYTHEAYSLRKDDGSESSEKRRVMCMHMMVANM